MHAEISQSATAQRIMQAAEQLFMQRGYRAVSINDIVHAASVTKPTLYYYFADKEALFVQMALHTLQAMHAAMQARLHPLTTTPARLVALAEVMLHETDGDVALMRREIEEHLGPAAREQVNAAFGRYLFGPVLAVMQQGLARGDLQARPAAELAWLFLSMLSGFRQQPGQHLPAVAQAGTASFSAATIVDLFLHGVGGRLPIAGDPAQPAGTLPSEY